MWKWRPRIAALIGNGFSIPYNTDLMVPNLTKSVVDAFEPLTGGAAEAALSEFAGNFHGYAEDDFEALLTPLESVGSALMHLAALRQLGASGSQNLEDALQTSAAFCQDAYRVGLGTVLQLIANAGARQGNESFHQATVVEPCRRMSDLKRFGPLSVATLNYDGLLHSGFLDCLGKSELDDLSAGYEQRTLMPDGKTPLSCHPLRDRADLRKKSQVHLLNLHGSLGWLEDESGAMWKFQLDDLRNCGYWEAFKAGETPFNPVVVLTNRKRRRVSEAPFNLAYALFEERLLNSDRWLIAGYSLGDEPLNAIFRRATAARKKWGKPPRVLVLSIGDDEDSLRASVTSKLGIDDAALRVDLTGLPGSIGGAEWEKWAA